MDFVRKLFWAEVRIDIPRGTLRILPPDGHFPQLYRETIHNAPTGDMGGKIHDSTLVGGGFWVWLGRHWTSQRCAILLELQRYLYDPHIYFYLPTGTSCKKTQQKEHLQTRKAHKTFRPTRISFLIRKISCSKTSLECQSDCCEVTWQAAQASTGIL